MITCAICGKENRSGTAVCAYCGVPMTKRVIYASGELELYVMGERDPLHVSAPRTEAYVLGRSDSKSSYVPDIDLAEFGARERGVSRRHAVLVRYQDMVHIVDLSSANGTFLNGTRLTADVPYALSSNDQINLGNLTLVVVQESQ